MQDAEGIKIISSKVDQLLFWPGVRSCGAVKRPLTRRSLPIYAAVEVRAVGTLLLSHHCAVVFPCSRCLRWTRIVVQRHADRASMVSVVLSYDGRARDFPQAGVMVGTDGDKVRRVSRKGAVPYPALMRLQYRLELQRRAFGDYGIDRAEGVEWS